MASPPPLLATHGLVFAAGGRTILSGIAFHVSAGERVAVIGPNGSGKSTLLRCLYGWHRPTAGTVTLAGRDLATMTGAARAQAIAVLTQETETGLGLDVAAVVALGCAVRGLTEGAVRDVVHDALAAVGLAGWQARSMQTLSGGERQRVMVARALAQVAARASTVLILDEPTNHLDIRHQLDLLEVVRQRGGAAVASLHDLTLAARWADRIYLLDGGRVAAAGRPADVLDPALIGAIYGVETVRDADPRTGGVRLSFHRRTPA